MLLFVSGHSNVGSTPINGRTLGANAADSVTRCRRLHCVDLLVKAIGLFYS